MRCRVRLSLAIATFLLMWSVPAAAEQPSLRAMARAQPSVVAVGQQARIEVQVLDRGGFAAGAAVVVDAGGGAFAAAGGASVLRGETDARGRLVADWSCTTACAASYLMTVVAETASGATSEPFVVWVEVAGGGVASGAGVPAPRKTPVRPAPLPLAADTPAETTAAASPPPASRVAEPPAPPRRARWADCAWVEVGAIRSRDSREPWCPTGSFLVGLEAEAAPDLDPHASPLVARAQCCALAQAEREWRGCVWKRVGPRLSHEPDAPWCEPGSFLAQLRFDSRRDATERDAPVVAEGNCCSPAGAASGRWGECSLEQIGSERTFRSSGPWCGEGSFLVELDLDSPAGAGAAESPIVGAARCCRPRF